MSSHHSSPNKKGTNGKPSIYEQIGGEPSIKAACKLFASRLEKDSRTAAAFGPLDNVHQVLMLTGFISHVTGGPAYTGPSMYEFHRGLTLTEADYDAYLAVLKKALEDSDLEPATVRKIMREFEEQRVDVLGSDKKSGLEGGCCKSWAVCWTKCKLECQHNVYVQAAGATAVLGLLALGSFYAVKALRK